MKRKKVNRYVENHRSIFWTIGYLHFILKLHGTKSKNTKATLHSTSHQKRTQHLYMALHCKCAAQLSMSLHIALCFLSVPCSTLTRIKKTSSCPVQRLVHVCLLRNVLICFINPVECFSVLQKVTCIYAMVLSCIYRICFAFQHLKTKHCTPPPFFLTASLSCEKNCLLIFVPNHIG